MDVEDVERTEHAPLLGRDGGVAEPIRQPKLLTRHIIIILGAFFCKLFFSLGSAFVELPLLQLQEAILCDRFNSTGPPDFQSSLSQLDGLWPCKQEDVQKELSILRQWLIMSQLLPTLLVGVPMGIVADRYGRTFVLGLALFGATLALGASVLICTSRLQSAALED